jgi:hypothetical protein
MPAGRGIQRKSKVSTKAPAAKNAHAHGIITFRDAKKIEMEPVLHCQ